MLLTGWSELIIFDEYLKGVAMPHSQDMDSMNDYDRLSDARDNCDPEPRRHSQACQCGTDMPGRCPGPDNCPMCMDDAPGDDD
jgi:hypothetical protein